MEVVVGADLPSFIDRATPEVLCALQTGIRIIDGRHWAGVVTDGNPYPFNRALKRAIAGNDRALASVRIDTDEMVGHVQTVIDDASAIARRFLVSEPLTPPPRSRFKKR